MRINKSSILILGNIVTAISASKRHQTVTVHSLDRRERSSFPFSMVCLLVRI